MPKAKIHVQAADSAAFESPDLTNTCFITFFSAVWTVVAALVAHAFMR